MTRGWRLVFLATATATAWVAALAYAMLTARILYADGAWSMFVHLMNPLQFNDYDPQRTFASYITQSPILLGQALGLRSVASYAALYTAGDLVLPAAALLAALFLARRQPGLFAANVLAIAVFGFGLNFINSEANLFFGLVWLCITILALEGSAPRLRMLVLPLLAFVLLRVYDGMLVVGPILALWAFAATRRVSGKGERLGIAVAAVLFFAGAAIGFNGFLSPRDPVNASSFLASTLLYFKAPQFFLLLSSIAAVWAFVDPRRWVRISAAVTCVALGLAFLGAMLGLRGFYAYRIYYQGRGFLVLSLPVFALALAAIWQWRPHWLARDGAGPVAILLVPIACAIASDVLGTYRWQEYTRAFCAVLQQPGTPRERFERLSRSGTMTSWSWTNSALSVLLRGRSSDALVANDPSARVEAFSIDDPPRFDYTGLCPAPESGSGGPAAVQGTISFQGGQPPAWVAEIRGLSAAEQWGTWSEGSRVEIRFAQPLPPAFDLRIQLGNVFGSNNRLPVRVQVGGQEQSFIPDHVPFDATLAFRGLSEARTSIAFEIPRPESPLELGLSQDPRKLGIGFFALTVTPR